MVCIRWSFIHTIIDLAVRHGALSYWRNQVLIASPNSTQGSTQMETLRPHLGATIQLHHPRRATELGMGNDSRVFKYIVTST